MPKSYEDGLVEGKISSLEKMSIKHEGRMDSHSISIKNLEKLMYVAGGMAIAIQAIPAIQLVLRALS